MLKRFLIGGTFAVGVAVLSIPAMTVSSNAAAFTVPTQLEEVATTMENVHWRRYPHAHRRRGWKRHCHPRWWHSFNRPFCHYHRRLHHW